MPISRVRWMTVTSMTFMMPMPPTTSEIDAMAPMTTLKILWLLWLCPSPTAWQRLVVAARIAVRVRRQLRRLGMLQEPAGEDVAPDDIVAACQAGSARGLAALGERAGQPVRRVRLPRLPSQLPRAGESQAIGGFDLHVGPTIPATDRARLERLCRYLLRPALASGRLHEQDDGTVRYDLPHPWRDGTTGILVSASELIERLVALVPAASSPAALPRHPRTASPVALGRRAAAAASGQALPRRGRRDSLAAFGSGAAHAAELGAAAQAGLRGGLSCPRCAQPMEVVATVDDPVAARAILEHLGLAARPPPLSPVADRPSLSTTGGA
jgi:hypothetical protein